MPRARNAPVPASPRARKPHLVGLSVVPDPPGGADGVPDGDLGGGEVVAPPTTQVGSIPIVVGDRHTEGRKWAPSGAKVAGRRIPTTDDNPTRGDAGQRMVEASFAQAPLERWVAPGGEDAAATRLLGGVAVVAVAVVVAWALWTQVPGPAWRVLWSLLLVLVAGPVAVGVGWALRWERTLADPTGVAPAERDHFISRPAAGGALMVVVGWLLALWGGPVGGPALVVGVVVVVGVLVMRTSAVVVERRGVQLQRPAGGDPAERVYEVWARLAATPEKGQGRREVAGLTGSHLTRVNMLSDGGWSADIRLPDMTADTWEAIAKERRRIAKAFRTRTEWIHVSGHRTGAATHAAITVHQSDALAEAIPWGRTLSDKGRVRIGWHADGTPCWWNLWHSGSGALHCLIAGSTRTGKSGLIQGLLMELACYAHAFVILCDPKQGKSMIHMNEHVDHLALEDDDIVRAIRGTRAALETRKRSDMGAWSPSRTWPLIVLVIDEATEVLGKPDLRALVADDVDTIARQGAGLGILLCLGTQTYIKESLGGVGVVSNLGNIASMRMDDLEARDRLMRMLGGGDLTAIPEGDAGRGRGLVRNQPVQMRVEHAQPGDPAWVEFLQAKKPHALDPATRRAWESVVRPAVPKESFA